MLKPTIKAVLITGLFASLSAFAAEEPVAAKLDMGKAKQTASTLCVACHNADGNSAIAQNPKLAGQGAQYIYKQLHDFKSWNGKPAERANAVMGGMVASLEEADMHALAAYFSSQKLTLGEAKDRKTIEQGQKIWRGGINAKGVPACAGCHGPTGAGLPAMFPRLQAQHTEYTEAQLKAFRDGGRENDTGAMMRAIALKMTDAEIRAVAGYIQGLR